MFSRSSRSSSAHSINSVGEDIPPPINVIVTENPDTIQNIMDDDDIQYDTNDIMTNPSVQLSVTQSHPLGRILLSLLKDSTNLAEKAKLKKMESEINDLCTNFYDSVRLEKAKLQKQRKQVVAEVEASILEKELNSHMLNLDMDPPTNFSLVPTLMSAHQRADAMKLFPCRGTKFLGISNTGMDVTEFLSMVTLAQEQCSLSEKEFKEMLLLSTTGKAHALVSEWVNNGDSVATIYHNLLIHFDKRSTPEECKQQLLAYKAPKTSNLARVEAHIMFLANRAAKLLPHGETRNHYRNLEMVQALIRCLPPQSSSLVQTKFNELSARLGRVATAIELSRALTLSRHVIDSDIRTHGHDTMRGRKLVSNNNNNKIKRYTTYAIAQRNFPQQQLSARSQNMTPQNSHTQRNRFMGPRNVNFNKPQQGQVHTGRNSGTGFRSNNNKSGNANIRSTNRPRPGRDNDRQFRQPYPSGNSGLRYCSLCGQKNHTASDDCPNMVNDSGSVIKIHPTLGTCSVCPAKIQPRLNHPPAVCPYRKGGPFSKSQ